MLRWGEKEYGLDQVGDNLSGTVKECLEVNKKNYKKLFEQLQLGEPQICSHLRNRIIMPDNVHWGTISSIVFFSKTNNKAKLFEEWPQ